MTASKTHITDASQEEKKPANNPPDASQEDTKPAKNLARELAFTGTLVFGVTAARGWWIASAVGGVYPLSAVAIDFVALSLIVAVFRLIDFGIHRGLLRCLGEGGWKRNALVGLLRNAAVLLLVGPFFLTYFQLHPPRVACVGDPSQHGMKFDDLTLDSHGARIAAWHIPAERPDRPFIVITHGLGSNKENFLPAAKIAHDLELNVVMLDFRAHGNSEGWATSLGILEAHDVAAAHDWIAKNHPDQPIFAWGNSVGGAAVLRAAADGDLFDKILIDASFSSVRSVAHATTLQRLGPLKEPAWQMLRFWGWVWTGVDAERNSSAEALASITDRPVLLIHGDADQVVPHAESFKLRAASGDRAELWLVEGAGHTACMHREEYPDRLRAFLLADEATRTSEDKPTK
ncbi:MAG: alpha/beta fold hydrolase [Planctomycetales bacterium]